MSRRRRAPWTSSALIALSVIGLASFGVGSAAPVAQTVNPGNHVSTMTVQPPTNVNAALSFQLLPLPSSCTAQITWTASPSTGVDAYEIRRVIAATGVVTGGSWSVGGNVLAYTDSKVPLALPVNTAEWHVRALVGAWPSDWAVATVDNPVLCLLGG